MGGIAYLYESHPAQLGSITLRLERTELNLDRLVPVIQAMPRRGGVESAPRRLSMTRGTPATGSLNAATAMSPVHRAEVVSATSDNEKSVSLSAAATMAPAHRAEVVSATSDNEKSGSLSAAATMAPAHRAEVVSATSDKEKLGSLSAAATMAPVHRMADIQRKIPMNTMMLSSASDSSGSLNATAAIPPAHRTADIRSKIPVDTMMLSSASDSSGSLNATAAIPPAHRTADIRSKIPVDTMMLSSASDSSGSLNATTTITAAPRTAGIQIKIPVDMMKLSLEPSGSLNTTTAIAAAHRMARIQSKIPVSTMLSSESSGSLNSTAAIASTHRAAAIQSKNPVGTVKLSLASESSGSLNTTAAIASTHRTAAIRSKNPVGTMKLSSASESSGSTTAAAMTGRAVQGPKARLPESSCPVKSIDVWAHNFDAIIDDIQILTTSPEDLLIGMDTEFCSEDGPWRPWTEPQSPEVGYSDMRVSVDNGDLIQVGVVTAKDWTFSNLVAYEFNIMFDSRTRPVDSNNIKFLKGVGFKFEELLGKGIALESFIQGLFRSGLLHNYRITWITYQGFADFGYLIRGLQGRRKMSEERLAFLSSVANAFPHSYDIKIFHTKGICTRPSTSGLKALALELGVERIGREHTACSDALLTLHCFRELLLREVPFSPFIKFHGLLYGVSDEASEDPARSDVNVRKVNVDRLNVQTHISELSDLFPLSGVVSVEVTFSSEVRTDTYARACHDVALTAGARIELTVSDPKGWPAKGKLWVFNLDGKALSTSPAMLGKLLKRTGATSNCSVIWISSSSGAFVYLAKALSAGALPESRVEFLALCKDFFPALCIVPQQDPERPPGALATLRNHRAMRREGHLLPRGTISDLSESDDNV